MIQLIQGFLQIGFEPRSVILGLLTTANLLAHGLVIRTAIKRGLIGNLTQEMIVQAESKVRDLQGRLATPRPADVKAFSVLPEVVQRRLEALEHAIGRT